MSEAKNTIKKMSIMTMGPIINILIGLFSVPITTRLLLPEEFGKATMYSTAYGILAALIQLGLVYSLRREYREWDDKKKLTFHAVIPSLGLFFILLIPLLFVRKEISQLLFNGYHPAILFILELNLLIEIFLALSGAILQMQERALKISLSSILNRVISFIVTVGLLVFYKKDFTSIILGQTVSHTVQFLYQYYYTRDHWGFTSLDRSLMKVLLLLGLPVLPATMLGWISNSVDKFALKHWCSLHEIGIYGAANKFVILVTVFSTAFGNLWMPVSLRWRQENKHISIFKRTNVLVGLAMSYVIIGIIFFKDILIYYFGAEYYNAKYVMPFLLLVPAMTMFSSVMETAIHVEKKSYIILILSLISLFCNIVGNYFLVPPYGALGAAMATSFSLLIMWLVNLFISIKIWDNIVTGRFIVILIGLFSVPFVSLLGGFLYIPWGILVIIVITLVNRAEFLEIGAILLSMGKNLLRRLVKAGRNK
ncbi:MAG: polysaccharide biosynthesis protein [Spirochaetales bacterium]|nr:polysaccharide biosynthesis protein [Spirochaetales bacterium]